MKLKHTAAAFALLIGFGIFTAFYQENLPNESEAVKLAAVTNILERAHFDPLEYNDEFSSHLFDKYIESVDFNKRFLTSEEVTTLEPYRLLLDDEIRDKKANFYHDTQELLQVGVKRSEKFVNEILSAPFDFSIEEEIITDIKKLERTSSVEGLKEYWRKSLKLEVLDELRSKIESQEKKAKKDSLSEDDQIFIAKTRVELEEEIREDTKDLYSEFYERIEDIREVDRFGEYLNSITSLYDPHSNYFSPRAKEDFDITMGRSLEGIGARLRDNKDHVTIVSIVPGGPAWKQKQLEVDDKIISVLQEEDEEPVNVVGWRTQDVVPMIRGKKGTDVILKVEKVDGSEVDIKITRDKVILDEGKARSAIISREGVIDNVGYISLPRFYADFDDPKGSSCADDIKAELEKLKLEGVNGIILDLRNNGGGSLQDVIEMSGFFIEDGPIVQVKGREKKPMVYQDKDKSIIYDGPLIVMVNHNSASASEILAAALQDYDRAVIIGSTSTFGKGTVQRFLDLDRYVMGNEEYKPLGQLKVTMQKFYRINGGSTQLEGVVPDIILPDSRHYLKFGEKNLDNPLEWTEIAAAPHSLEVAKITNMSFLQSQSQARIENKEGFQKVLENAKRLKNIRDHASYPIAFEAYDMLMDAREEEAKKYKKIFSEIEELEVINLMVDMEHIQADSSRIARNDNWLKRINKDHYIDESLHILQDLSEQNNIVKKD